jgi:diguanylate cyclase (GGDEF)-like protein
MIILLNNKNQELKELYSLAMDANSITGLPGNNSIAEHVVGLMEAGTCATVLYADIDNFKAFNDYYGFARGDEVIAAAVETMKATGEKLKLNDKIFYGHVGGDDFVMTCPCEEADHFAGEILESFN